MNSGQLNIDKYKSLFNLSIDMLCIADRDGYLKLINPAFSRTLDYSEEEILSRPFMDFVHPDDLEKTRAIYKAQIEEGETIVNLENRYLHKDGTYRILSWTSSIDLETNLIYGAAGDTTARHRAELKFAQIQAMLDAETIFTRVRKYLFFWKTSMGSDTRSGLRPCAGNRWSWSCRGWRIFMRIFCSGTLLGCGQQAPIGIWQRDQTNWPG